jgi:chromosomal replication initiator protein
MNDLEKIKEHLKSVLDEPSFNKWIEPLKYIGTLDETLFIGAPDRKIVKWLKQNLLENINSYCRKNLNLSLKLVSIGDDEEVTERNETRTAPAYNSNLIARFTFENFVQSPSNRIPYSFAYNVSEYPGKNYNPLYIYSGVGLGKTHLMHAIGNRIVAQNKNLKVVYLTTSDLMNEYVEYTTRLKNRSEFIKKYTSVDVLLIDDIQYITKWGGTSEQFYYIFNSLIQQEKQIVICSDKHPSNIPDLENRIKSRFEMGGVVDILPYDLETRIAILKQKIKEKQESQNSPFSQFSIEPDVTYFIASAIRDNVRKLEGALNRILGVASLKLADNKDFVINMSFAKEAMKNYFNLNKEAVTIDKIQDFVADKYNIRTDELKSKNNSPKFALPRQIAMYMSKKLTRVPLAEIGNAFGGKHHTTVLHSINKIEKKIETDADFSREVENYVEFFTN